MALLALREKRVTVLKLCLEQGDPWKSEEFRAQAERVDAARLREIASMLAKSRGPTQGGSGPMIDDEGDRARRDALQLRRAGMFDEGGEYPVKW